MSEHPGLSSEFVLDLQQLIDECVFGAATFEQVERLNRLLIENVAARKFYVQSVATLCSLRKWGEYPLSGAGGDGPDQSAPPGQDVSSVDHHTTPASADEQPAKSPVLGFLGGVVDYINHSRRLMFLLIAAMLCGWFVVQIGSVLFGRWRAGDAQVADVGADGAKGPNKPEDRGLGSTEQAHGQALAWLTGSVSGQWQVVAGNPAGGKPAAGKSAPPAFWDIGTEFNAGQQVKLVAGLGEITFRSGAKVVLSAPAQFSITSATGTDLQLGKLAARVPHSATGFAVITPAGSVVDLGTEFGVEVTPDHKMDVQVFVGEVKVNAPSGGGEVAEPAGVHVTAGHAIHVAPGQPAVVIESKANRFHRDLELNDDSNDRQTTAYLDFVRQLKPAVWFRMEGKEGDKTLHDEMGHAADAKLHWDGPGNPFVNGRLGKGLWLRGTKLADYAVVPDYPQADHQKFTVSAWAYADSEEQISTIVCNWGDTNGVGQFWIGRHGQSLDGLITRRDGHYVPLYQQGPHSFPLHEWQHVALVTDGSKAHLYLQGRELMAVEHDGFQYPVRLKALGIGMRPGDAGDAPSRESPALWSGQVDEILIFNEALAAADIQKLAAAPPR